MNIFFSDVYNEALNTIVDVPGLIQLYKRSINFCN